MADWQDDAACRADDVDPEWFFIDGKNRAVVNHVRRICAACPVRTECLRAALEHGNATFGIWGGTNQDERRAIGKKLSLPGPSALADVAVSAVTKRRRKARRRAAGAPEQVTNDDRPTYRTQTVSDAILDAISDRYATRSSTAQ